MQMIFESIFDFFYLVTITSLAIYMLKNNKNEQLIRLFGIMALVLGIGDAFHLIPRVYALLTTGLDNHVEILGIGKLITSITMTVFYLILYFVCKKRFNMSNTVLLDKTVITLTVLRIALCLFPQNRWLYLDGSLSWSIIRNIPFLIIGIIVMTMFYKESKKLKDTTFRFMWLAITLSFVFYIPVVLFAKTVPIVGVLMIPKTLCYVWIVFMGFKMSKEKVSS